MNTIDVDKVVAAVDRLGDTIARVFPSTDFYVDVVDVLLRIATALERVGK